MLNELQNFHVLVDVEVKPLPVTLDGEFWSGKIRDLEATPSDFSTPSYSIPLSICSTSQLKFVSSTALTSSVTERTLDYPDKQVLEYSSSRSFHPINGLPSRLRTFPIPITTLSSNKTPIRSPASPSSPQPSTSPPPSTAAIASVNLHRSNNNTWSYAPLSSPYHQPSPQGR